MFPAYWQSFLDQYSLTGKMASVPEDVDMTGHGAELTFMAPNESKQEAEDFYPGIAVVADGYVPVGNCEIGTGDPYFINSNDGPNGPLYRIYHEAVHAEEGYDASEAIATVLDRYNELLEYLE